MRLATLCMNWQRCCLPLHMVVRLTSAVDSVQVWTYYSCYAIVESIWSEVVFVRCVTKMDRLKFEQHCAIKFCVKLVESATVTYEKLQRAYGEHSNCQSNFLSGSPWKTEVKGGMCATRHCTHLNAAPRQCPMSHSSLHQWIFGRKKHSCGSSAPIFAGSQSLWLLYIPPAQKPIERAPFWYFG